MARSSSEVQFRVGAGQRAALHRGPPGEDVIRMAKRKQTTHEKIMEGVQWRKTALAQIEVWANEQEGPVSSRSVGIIARRFDRLEAFVRAFFPGAGPAPFAFDDAAALVVLPKRRALKLARKLFGGGPGICRDLQEDDLTWNMDWFVPPGQGW